MLTPEIDAIAKSLIALAPKSTPTHTPLPQSTPKQLPPPTPSRLDALERAMDRLRRSDVLVTAAALAKLRSWTDSKPQTRSSEETTDSHWEPSDLAELAIENDHQPAPLVVSSPASIRVLSAFNAAPILSPLAFDAAIGEEDDDDESFAEDLDPQVAGGRSIASSHRVLQLGTISVVWDQSTKSWVPNGDYPPPPPYALSLESLSSLAATPDSSLVILSSSLIAVHEPELDDWSLFSLPEPTSMSPADALLWSPRQTIDSCLEGGDWYVLESESDAAWTAWVNAEEASSAEAGAALPPTDSSLPATPPRVQALSSAAQSAGRFSPDSPASLPPKDDLLAGTSSSVSSILGYFHAITGADEEDEELARMDAGDDTISPRIVSLVRGSLCASLAFIFSHRFATRRRFRKHAFWDFIREACSTSVLASSGWDDNPAALALHDTVTALSSSAQKSNKSMMFRTLICLGLNARYLDLWFTVLFSHPPVVAKHYPSDAFVADPSYVDSLVSILEPLASLPFSLSPDFELSRS